MLLAEIDWTTLVGALATGLTVVVGGLGTAGKFMLDYLRDRSKEQQLHELSTLERFERITAKFDQCVRDGRAEQQEIVTTLLGIQKETVNAVSDLSGKVADLGQAIQELRADVSRKQDRTQPP